MEYEIRIAAEADIEAINRLFNEMLQAIYKTDTVQVYEPGYLEDHYFHSAKNIIYAAEYDHKVIGYMAIEYHDEADEPFLYLDDLCVTEEWRGRGIGTQFFACAERYAAQYGVRSIHLHVNKQNIPAYRLYRRLGFTDDKDEGTRIRMRKKL